jgi:hypothetical protein
LPSRWSTFPHRSSTNGVGRLGRNSGNEKDKNSISAMTANHSKLLVFLLLLLSLWQTFSSLGPFSVWKMFLEAFF